MVDLPAHRKTNQNMIIRAYEVAGFSDVVHGKSIVSITPKLCGGLQLHAHTEEFIKSLARKQQTHLDTDHVAGIHDAECILFQFYGRNITKLRL